MRKTLSLVFFSLVLVLSAYTVTLSAQDHVPPGQYCSDNGDFGLDHGTCASCVAFLQNGNPQQYAVCVCKIYKDLGILAAAGVNQGQCIQIIRGSI